MFTVVFLIVAGYVFNKELNIRKLYAAVAGLVLGISIAATISLFAPKEIYVQKAEYFISIKSTPKFTGNFLTGLESSLFYRYSAITPDRSIVQKEIENKYVYFYPYSESSPFIAKTSVRLAGLWGLIGLPFNEPYSTQIYMPAQYIPQ